MLVFSVLLPPTHILDVSFRQLVYFSKTAYLHGGKARFIAHLIKLRALWCIFAFHTEGVVQNMPVLFLIFAHFVISEERTYQFQHPEVPLLINAVPGQIHEHQASRQSKQVARRVHPKMSVLRL